MDVSVRNLKNHLSEYLRRAAAGEDIRVTSHGRVIAHLTAADAQPETDEAFIERLGALSWMNPPEAPGGKPQGASVPSPARPDTPSTDDLMDWVRG